ncbi:MAG: class I SAM-dependent methyltransferase [Candidatus Shapirobacteria bacterium]
MTKDELKQQINVLTQFPHKERSQPYQSYYLKDEGYIKGTRDTLYRFDIMKIEKDLSGKSVLDLGCQLGTMGVEAYRRGAGPVLGIEYEKDYVSCAKALAKYNEFDITFIQGDLTKGDEVPKLVNKFFNNKPVDVVLALALYKHVKEHMFKVLSKIKFKTLYIESHNTGTAGLETQHVKEMLLFMKKYDYSPVFIDFVADRSLRAIWRIDCHDNEVL